ncbi:MAG: toll/interleukin-1 receptor domain-containing protein [Algoriphagus sp.]|uniref:toll/interleukin-1 receptor domain-containing protein n=1 Tax=Algoriphagus sp. TaxID=1872435 RepID=UPI00273168F4|nr:toll/interleukin-1 receptor domain-containing protein [Algoriphagus sp.]MDP2041844.1 toll/interleukin-1 receptor domain-containing protein [Algoriphagus sp.]MDP3473152.1 toll/interleukin-1 receptor domain-containing protein [Algoriphagus sp.]
MLKTMIVEADELRDYHRDSAKFKTWEDKVYRRIINIYGEDSREYYGFKGINFHKRSITNTEAVTSIGKAHMGQCLDESKMFFEGLIEDVELFPKKTSEESTENGVKKIFISHSSDDDLIGQEVINLLQLIGVKPNQIFYTSAAGYGVALGTDWVETLKSVVSSDGIVLSLLSENYFNSQICLLEMGATWVLSKFHIPILIPPLLFKTVNEMINTTQGFVIIDKHRWTSLKGQLEKLFDLEPLDGDKWEPQRDAILARIEKHLTP